MQNFDQQIAGKLKQSTTGNRATGKNRKSRRLKRQVLPFTRNLASLLQANVPLLRAIEMLEHQENHKKFGAVISKIRSAVSSGQSLKQALSLFPGLFPRLYLNLVEAGENAGILGDMLERLQDYLEKREETRRKLVQIMTYPVLVITVAIGAVTFLLLQVVPTFADMFRDFDAQLPRITRIVLAFSTFLSNYFLYIFISVTGLVVLFVQLLKSGKSRQVADRLVLKIPLIGSYLKKTLITQFCMTLGTLLKSGIPLMDALDIAEGGSGNVAIQLEINRMKYFASRGQGLNTSLRNSKIFPELVIGLIEIGEETANLDVMLLKMAQTYKKETDYFLQQLTTFMEPAIIILLGLVIGVILVSIYLPMFELSNVIQ